MEKDEEQDTEARILVADIMKSLTVYKFRRSTEAKRLSMEARDPNGLWCIEMAKVPYKEAAADSEEWNVDEEEKDHVDNEFYLTADFDQNLTLLQRQKRRVDEHEDEEFKGQRHGKHHLQV